MLTFLKKNMKKSMKKNMRRKLILKMKQNYINTKKKFFLSQEVVKNTNQKPPLGNSL